MFLLLSTDRLPRKRFELAINDGHLRILKLTLQRLYGFEGRIDLQRTTGFMGLQMMRTHTNTANVTHKQQSIMQCSADRMSAYMLCLVSLNKIWAYQPTMDTNTFPTSARFLLLSLTVRYLQGRRPELGKAGSQVFGTLSQLHSSSLIRHSRDCWLCRYHHLTAGLRQGDKPTTQLHEHPRSSFCVWIWRQRVW